MDWGALAMLGLRIVLALYLVASALARFDQAALRRFEIVLRLLAAVLVLWKTATVMWVGLILAGVLIAGHLVAAKALNQRATA